MMIKIDAIVREEKFEDVKQALNEIGVNGITVSQVMGCGIQRGYKEIVRGMQVDMQMQPRRSGRRRQWMLSENPLIPEKWGTEKFLPMKYVPFSKSVQTKPVTTQFRPLNKRRICRTDADCAVSISYSGEFCQKM